MKKVLFLVTALIICVMISLLSGVVKPRETLPSLSELTANGETDRVIGKYTDDSTGNEVYRPVEVKYISEYEYRTDASGKNSVFFKYRDASGGDITEMEYMQPDYKRHICGGTANDGIQNWGMERTGTNRMSGRLSGSKNVVVVAVVDTGTDLKHDFLSGRVIPGYDFVENDNDPSNESEDEAHGTHVSGIIAGSTPENIKSCRSGYSEITEGMIMILHKGYYTQ